LSSSNKSRCNRLKINSKRSTNINMLKKLFRLLEQKLAGPKARGGVMKKRKICRGV